MAPEVAKKSAPWVMSPEQIVREAHTLSDDFSLSPPQLAGYFQTTEDQLKTMRETGDGPDFFKLGGGAKSPVRYKMGKVREWEKAHTYKNTSQLNVSRFDSLANFLSVGAMDDMYIVAKEANGRTWEFWEAIRQQVDIEEVVWQPMDQILEGFRKGAGQRFADSEAEELRYLVNQPIEDGRVPTP